MKVAITGATGFIGKELLIDCPNDIELLALTRKSITAKKYIKYDDLFDVKAEHLVGCESFVHLAGVAHTAVADPETYTQYNTELVSYLANEAVKANIKRFIFISTIGVNGLNSGEEPFKPSDLANPHNDYALSKYNAEQELRSIAKKTGLEVVIIRPVLVYGKEAPGSFSLLLKMISKFGVLPFGFVKNKRSFIAVQNLVDFIILCLKHEKAAGQIFLASDGQVTSTKAFTNSIAKGINKTLWHLPVPVSLMKLTINLLGKPTLSKQLFDDLEVDSSNMFQLLNWTPPNTMNASMRQLTRETHD
ncbi:NAD-dependent epimerase/dehydratase family protein [Pseudoalteromonas sp. FUC4]|uniref:NAD-dependent epimerase/dehydratase family protein n=1 Tax=Pseudoalteromonas sp. FUC4 TaxID=2511201 RepID=UPI0011F2AC4F|nr:NAD-dependent epimerase/dehydratase family protein [Pseudoalteromonas sp. FUC4]KAA1152426.1 NAD-dependent epimerase/dehydratase family protein [Pseudoalteromonas sp. FUC4]